MWYPVDQGVNDFHPGPLPHDGRFQSNGGDCNQSLRCGRTASLPDYYLINLQILDLCINQNLSPYPLQRYALGKTVQAQNKRTLTWCVLTILALLQPRVPWNTPPPLPFNLQTECSSVLNGKITASTLSLERSDSIKLVLRQSQPVSGTNHLHQ